MGERKPKSRKGVMTKPEARKSLKTKLALMNKKIAEAIKLFKKGKAEEKAKAVKLLQEVEVMKKDLIIKELPTLIHISFGSIYWELVSMNLQLDGAIFGINTGHRTDKEILDYMKQAKKDKEDLERTTRLL